jgi:hypothetical protein
MPVHKRRRIDAFVLKWKKTRGVPIQRKEVVITVSSTSYSIVTIDAMTIWYRLLKRYDELDCGLLVSAMLYSSGGWFPGGSSRFSRSCKPAPASTPRSARGMLPNGVFGKRASGRGLSRSIHCSFNSAVSVLAPCSSVAGKCAPTADEKRGA